MFAMKSDAAADCCAAGQESGRVAVETKPLCPGRYGERTCQCQGILVEMRQGTGWVQPLQAIDHPTAHWNRGKVYLAERDMRRPGQALRPGDLMVFFLYSDSKGLGAEDCFPLRDPNAIAAAEELAEVCEPPARSWKPPTKSWDSPTKPWEPWGTQKKSWEPWWKHDGENSSWPAQKKEPWWWKREQSASWSYPPAYGAAGCQASFWSPPSEGGSEEDAKGGCFTDEVTTKVCSSLSGGNSTCSGEDEDETKASHTEESSEELDGVAISAPPSPAASLVVPFKPPPGLELPPPAGPPPGLPPPRGLKFPDPSQQGTESPSRPTLSLVEMLPI